MVQKVKDGCSKADLLEQHGHVLGLSNVNIDIPAKKNTGDYGAIRVR